MIRQPRISMTAGAATVAGAVVALIGIAVPVFACSIVMGNLVLSTYSGPAGSVVYTTVTGVAPYPAKYDVHFGKTSADDCMAFDNTVTVLKTITANRRGGWTNKPVTIPATASQGTHELCAMQVYPSRSSVGTTHDVFTVT